MSDSKKAVSEFMLCIISGFAAFIPICCIGFALAQRFSLSVLFGALYGSAVMSVYYLMFAKATVKASDEDDPADAKKRVQAAHSLRMFYLAIAMGAGVIISMEFGTFHWLPLIASMLMPRISIAVWQIIQKKKETQNDGN